MDINEFRALLKIDKHRLDEDLTYNSELQEQIGREVAKRNTVMLRAKRELDEAESAAFARLKRGDEKMTNPQAEKAAKSDRHYLLAWDAYQEARQAHEEWESLHKAWVTRSYDMKALGELFGAQYFALDSVKGEESNRYTQARARLRSASAHAEMLVAQRRERRRIDA